MNTKINNVIKILAATTFLVALVLNLKLSFDDPSATHKLFKNIVAEETTEPILFDKNTRDCSITVKGEAGITFTFMGSSFTIPSYGQITVTVHDAAVDCPVGTMYLREDCTTRECGQPVFDPE